MKYSWIMLSTMLIAPTTLHAAPSAGGVGVGTDGTMGTTIPTTDVEGHDKDKKGSDSSTKKNKKHSKKQPATNQATAQTTTAATQAGAPGTH